MDDEQTLKILKLVEEGILTAEQGRRLLADLGSGAKEEPKTEQSRKTANTSTDFFTFMEKTAATIGAGLDSVLKNAGTSVDGVNQTLRGVLGLGPQNLTIKIVKMDDGQVRLSLNFPLKIFVALKGLLIQQKNSPFPLPLPPVDFETIFKALESGETGKIFEAADNEKREVLEVWVQ